MKIDRVILTLNNNPKYFNFWNIISKVWKTRFDIHPTLIFHGNKDDIINNGLSETYGTIIVQPPLKYTSDIWILTWSLFYYTKFFPNDTLITMGIDQCPLSDYFLKQIKDIPDDEYIMCISDAYGNDWTESGSCPSSYHIAKGKTFNYIYNFENSFEGEIKKIEANEFCKNGPFAKNRSPKWGMDELYSTYILRNLKKSGYSKIKCLNEFKELQARRIDRADLPQFLNIKNLQDGNYIEAHLPPVESKYENMIKIIAENINFYKQQ